MESCVVLGEGGGGRYCYIKYLQREIEKWRNTVRYYKLSHNLLGVLEFLFFFKRSGLKTSVISYVLVFHSLTGFSR